MAEGTIGDILKDRPSKGRPLRFALAWSLDMTELEASHTRRKPDDKPFDGPGYERGFRTSVAELNYGRVFCPDGSSYRPMTWEDHELELAILTLAWPVSLALIVSDPASKEEQPFAAKCFRDGKVYDWPPTSYGHGWRVVLHDSGLPDVGWQNLGSPEEPWRPYPSTFETREAWAEMLAELTPRSPRPCPHPPEVEAAPA